MIQPSVVVTGGRCPLSQADWVPVQIMAIAERHAGWLGEPLFVTLMWRFATSYLMANRLSESVTLVKLPISSYAYWAIWLPWPRQSKPLQASW